MAITNKYLQNPNFKSPVNRSTDFWDSDYMDFDDYQSLTGVPDVGPYIGNTFGDQQGMWNSTSAWQQNTPQGQEWNKNNTNTKDSGFGFNKGTADTVIALGGLYTGMQSAKAAKEANRLMGINMDRNYDFDIDNLQGTQVAFRNELQRNQHNANMMGFRGELETLPESKALANYNKQYNS